MVLLGYSTGPHAHFEVRLNGVVTDPMTYITNGIIPNTQNQTSVDQSKTETAKENTAKENERKEK